VASDESAATIRLQDVGGALATCDPDGCVLGCSPSGQSLLSRMGVRFEPRPALLPSDLWQLMSSSDFGTAVKWRSSGADHLLLGCTRYALANERWLLVMKEIGQKQDLLSQRMHQQRLEALGRLVATTVHDLRSPLSSIVFNSDVLAARADELPPDRVREAVADIKTASRRLRATIDCLLDYVRIGPPVTSEVSIKEILTRMQSLLRPMMRAGAHQLLDLTSPELDRVVGNPIAVEQIFLNLVLNSIEAAQKPVTVRVSSSQRGKLVRILVEDDGPGIRPEHRLQVFDPFFTTKPDGTGIGLSSAREAARGAGGDVQLVRWSEGVAFAVLLAACSAGESEA
jgi:signal transduction histidine kinase